MIGWVIKQGDVGAVPAGDGITAHERSTKFEVLLVP